MCTKCIIDPSKAAAAGTHLANSMKGWADTVAAFQDTAKSSVPLTDAEWAILMTDSQEQCDLADKINDALRKWSDRICAIAVAHSHPHHKPQG